MNIKSTSDPTLFADNTSVIISKANYSDFKQMSTHVPSLTYPWFEADQLVLSVEKPNTVKFKTTNLHYPPNTGLKKKLMMQLMKFLGTQTDNHLHWQNHTHRMLSKLSAAYYEVMMKFHISNTDTLQMIHFAYFHSVIKYEIILGGKSTDRQGIYITKKKI